MMWIDFTLSGVFYDLLVIKLMQDFVIWFGGYLFDLVNIFLINGTLNSLRMHL